MNPPNSQAANCTILQQPYSRRNKCGSLLCMKIFDVFKQQQKKDWCALRNVGSFIIINYNHSMINIIFDYLYQIIMMSYLSSYIPMYMYESTFRAYLNLLLCLFSFYYFRLFISKTRDFIPQCS